MRCLDKAESKSSTWAFYKRSWKSAAREEKYEKEIAVDRWGTTKTA